MNKLQILGSFSREWGLELSQLALANTLTLPGMGLIIPAASSVSQLESNAKVGQIALANDHLQAVRKVIAGAD